MKIAILSRYQNKTNRGVESFVTELVKRLSKNHHVDLLIGNESDSFSKIVKGHYDIVMPLNGRLQSLKASIGRIFSGYKMVIGGHSGIGRDDIFNIVIAKPDIFIALTKKMEKWSRKWAWGSKVVKIPNGIDLDNFHPIGEKYKHNLKGKVVLSVGALVWYKHHQKVIEAVSKLEEASLLIVGAGDEKRNLESLANILIPERFKIVSVDYQNIASVYRSADVFTLPSWDREAFGLVYLEALASNLPVVAPNDDSRREIVGDAGILIDTNDQVKYAEALKQALDKDWKDQPRKQAEKFSWDKIAKEYEICFESLNNR